MSLSIQLVFYAGLFFCIKHFIADGLLQTTYQYTNKGKWGHLGGLIHSGNHALLTFPSFVLPFVLVGADKPLWYIMAFGLIAAVADFIFHYLIDLTKIKITEHFGWTEMGTGTTKTDTKGRKALLIYDNKFFWAIMADQCLHFLTYIVLLCLMLAILLHTPHMTA